MTLQQAAQAALDVQTACNLSGVVRSFARITETLWAEARNRSQGTEWVNKHPIAQLFAVQIAHLATGCCLIGDSFDYHKAHAECERLAGAPAPATCPECERSNGPHYRGPCEHRGTPAATLKDVNR